jgi:hypothetical protein
MRSLAILLIAMLLPLSEARAFSLPKPIPGESQSISISGSTVRIKGLTNQDNILTLNGREIPVQPDGSFTEDVIIPLGETELIVKATTPDGKSSQYAKKIIAKENSFFLAGIADGTLNFSDVSEGFSLERDGKDVDDGFATAGKVSYYSTGKLHGKYLFKSSMDTDKSTQDDLFTYIDPDKYYPIYGDNSTVVYDVNSQGKFYGQVEWDKSGAVVGNYQTQIGKEGESLINYDRSLYGAKVHLETPKRTVYGDSVGEQTAFIAEANQRHGHSELLATGGSLYYLRHRNIAEGSEQVRIEVRDKRTGMVLSTVSQEQLNDYEMKYDEGRIIFRKPIMSIAASDTIISNSILEGNPVYVVADYEYHNQDAFQIVPEDLDDKAGGVRLSQHIGDHVRGGLTYIKEKQDLESYDLIGADATVKIGNFTRLDAEIAHSEANSATSFVSYNGGYDYTSTSVNDLEEGAALKVSANSSLGEYFGKEKGYMDLSGYWQKVDRNYAPVNSLYQAGTEKFGVGLAHEISENDNVRLMVEKAALEPGSNTNQLARDHIQASRLVDMTAQWTHDWDKFSFISEYLYKHEKNSLVIDQDKGHAAGHVIGERIQYRYNDLTTLFIGQQLGLTDTNDSFTSAGINRRLTDKISVHGQVAAGPAGNAVMAGFDKTVDSKNTVYSNYTLSNSLTDGKASALAFGSNAAISRTASLRRERQFVKSDSRGVYASNLIGYENKITPELTFDANYQRRDERQDPFTLSSSEARDAASVLVSYIKPDVWKMFSKSEYRMNSDNMWQVFLDNQGELKVSRDFYLFGEYEFSQVEDGLSRLDKKQVGVAYRPVDFDWFNALFKYINFSDYRPQNLTSADGGFFETQSKNDVFAGEYALDLPYNFQFVQKLAYKDSESTAVNTTNTVKTPDELDAILAVHRLNYHLTNKIDVAAEFRELRERGTTIREKERGFLFEITYQIIKNIAVGAGYNFTSFTDDLTVSDHQDARGFFIRLQGKY